MMKKLLLILLLISSIANAGSLTFAPAETGDPSDGGATGCGVSVSGSTLTINYQDGTALSASQKCKVGIKSNTSGQSLTAEFTANVAVTFGAASNTDGNLWGITEANWSDEMPFFFGVIYNGAASYLTLSRVPVIASGSAATDLCQLDDTDCDAQNDVMILTTGLTLASWVDLPIVQAGWVQGTYATTGNAWTFNLHADSGFNKEYKNIWFDFPGGQNGGEQTTRLSNLGGDGSGDVPTWATPANIIAKYRLFSNMVEYVYDTVNAGNCTNGDNSSTLRASLPFLPDPTFYGATVRRHMTNIITTGGGQKMMTLNVRDNTTPEVVSFTGSFAGVGGSSFSNAGDDIEAIIQYQIF